MIRRGLPRSQGSLAMTTYKSYGIAGGSRPPPTVFALFRHDVGIVPYEFWYCGRVETIPYSVDC